MSDSELETTFVNLLDRFAPELPEPLREQKCIPGRDNQSDFVWPNEHLIVEIDGGQWATGGGRHNGDRDRWKLNKLVMLGWKVLNYSGSMLEDGMLDDGSHAVINQVKEALLTARFEQPLWHVDKSVPQYYANKTRKKRSARTGRGVLA